MLKLRKGGLSVKNKIIVVGFVLYLAIFSVATLILPKKSFSQMENRVLAKTPVFSVEALIKGEFTEDIDSYLSDHIVGKDAFVKLKTNMDYLLGKKEVNEVYFGKNHRYIKKFQINERQLKNNLNSINTFAKEQKDANIYFLLAPNANLIYKEDLPKFTYEESQNKVYEMVEQELEENITLVNPTEELMAHKKEAIYFNTDHHWTMRGAYYGYKSLMDAMKLPVKPLNEYESSTLKEEFFGTLYSKAPKSLVKGDKIQLFYNRNTQCQVGYMNESILSNRLFALQNASIKDKYTVFLDGNHPLVRIKSNCDNNKKVLILKDSYAHCLVPFLTEQFNQIYMVDLRYFHGDLGEYMKENKIDTVIFIHNVDFLANENSFMWLK